MSIIDEVLKELRQRERVAASEKYTGSIRENVLQYVSDHMGEDYTIADMSRKLGFNNNSVHTCIHYLKKKNLLPKNFNHPYMNKPVKMAKKVTKIPVKVMDSIPYPIEVKTPVKEVVTEYDTWLDTKVWEFVKRNSDTITTKRLTDLLEFIKWTKENK